MPLPPHDPSISRGPAARRFAPSANPIAGRAGSFGRTVTAALLVLAIAGCHRQSVRVAPFRSRPDAVTAGDLRGPFRGRAIDASTGEPVAGALVYATWTLQRGYGMQEPAGFREAITSTDAGGHYAIPRLRGAPRGTRITDFYLVIYKRGYVAYRSNRRFSDFGPRRDFAQTQNRAELERWRGDLSHVRHLRFIGGGAAVRALTAWEESEAVAELSGDRDSSASGAELAPRWPSGSGGVVAAQVLREPEIARVTGFEGSFETGPLNDEPDTKSYSSQHFRAAGQPESFDVAVRVWKLSESDADQRYSDLLESLPGVEEADEIADRSLRASEGSIYGAGFVDRSRGVVVLLTCGVGQCKSPELAVELARVVHQNIRTLRPTAAEEKP